MIKQRPFKLLFLVTHISFSLDQGTYAKILLVITRVTIMSEYHLSGQKDLIQVEVAGVQVKGNEGVEKQHLVTKTE